MLVVHEERVLASAVPVPPGPTFKGYRDFVVQDLRIAPHNIRYRRECWRTPGGRLLMGPRSALQDSAHFSALLCTYVLYQRHHCHVTQPKLLEQLREWGLDLSSGLLDRLLPQKHAAFSAEKTAILTTGLAVHTAVTVDDSGALHAGANDYVLNVSAPTFANYESTKSKSRSNFLTLLHAGAVDYRINDAARRFMAQHGLPAAQLAHLRQGPRGGGPALAQLGHYMDKMGLSNKDHRRIVTEGALWGGLAPKIHPRLAVISDGAGQFDVGEYGLCWVHAERLVHKLNPVGAVQSAEQEAVRADIWALYRELKAYQARPTAPDAARLSARFDAVFTQKTSFSLMNALLARHHENKDKLLLVLRRPDVPLHTNGSETDLRDRVKKRKISGGTRSSLGRECRDTFASLMKTCRKLKVSFWQFLLDRLSLANGIAPLPELIAARCAA